MKNKIAVLSLIVIILFSPVFAKLIWSSTFFGDFENVLFVDNRKSTRLDKNCFEWGNTGGWIGRSWDTSQILNVFEDKVVFLNATSKFILPAGYYYSVGWICLNLDGTTVKELSIWLRTDKNSGFINRVQTFSGSGLTVTKTDINNYKVISDNVDLMTEVEGYSKKIPWDFEVEIKS